MGGDQNLVLTPLVADAEGEGVRDIAVLQFILRAPDRGAAAVRETEHGEGETLPPGETQLGIPQGKEPGIRALDGGEDAAFRAPGQGLHIRKRVVQPPAQSAVQLHFLIALVASVAQGGHGVRVVLLRRQLQHRDLRRHLPAAGVEVRDHQIRRDRIAQAVFVAPVAGDDEVPGPGPGDRAVLAAGNDDASAG